MAPKSREHAFIQKETERVKIEPDSMPPKFSFQFLVKHTNFGYESLEKVHKIALSNTLYKLSQSRWSEINQAHRHGQGYEKVMRSNIRFKLPDIITKDCEIIAFRFSGKAPMLGYRGAGDTFFIIAFDTKFKAYSH